MFKIELTGNLGADAEIKNDNGRQYVQFSVADTKKYKKEDGTEVENTNWVSCFLRNAESPVVPFLKKGTRVFVRGNCELRLYSSAKDRQMKAGASCNVSEIELIGGSQADEVPRELALPSGQILPVNKFYHINVSDLANKPDTVYDKRGRGFSVDDNGWVTPLPATNVVQQKSQQSGQQAQQHEVDENRNSIENEPWQDGLPFE